MNWSVFLQVLACCAVASVVATVSLYAIDKGAHPAWVVAAIFIGAAVIAGLIAP